MPKYIKDRYAQEYGKKNSYLDADVAIKIAPSPTGGWDAISPLPSMEPKYAVILKNWVPRPGWVEVRGGYNPWSQAVNSDDPVETLLIYKPPTGLQQMFAAAGNAIKDVSNYGIINASVTGLSNARFQRVMFTPSGGSTYLLAVNGADSYLAYNGSVWTNPVVTGISSSLFVHVNIFKRRVWFTQINSTSMWFLGTDAIAGAATQMDLGPFMSKGGFLIGMATWTVDGGNGPDDQAVFLTSEGQAIIYKGTDPTNANAWSLVGVFNLPKPIGRRSFYNLGADVLIITQQGTLPLSQSLPFDPVASRSVAITNRIQNAMLLSGMQYFSNFGWELMAFPNQSLLVMNVPQTTNSTSVQYVMNTLTGAWTQFTGWNANCFEVYNDSLYFGDSLGNVNLAYAGGLDKVSAIYYDMQCAFNYFDEPGRLKNANMIRPFLVADGTLVPTISIDVDFADSAPTAEVVILNPTGAIWDSSLWDASVWSTGEATIINWLSCSGLGTALAIRMIINLAGGGSSSSVSSSSVFDTGVFDTMVFDGNGVITASGVGVPVLKVNLFELDMEYGGPI